MASRLAVLVSSSGKTVELQVGAHARVDAVQQALAELTGIPQADQILMCEGARLDGGKALASYGLPGEEQGKVHDVFLYSRAHLRPDAPLPPPEQLPECPLDLSGLEAAQAQRHRLDEAASPLLRLLPDYQRQFRGHLVHAHARLEASQQRLATCAALVGEQEVQALSIDAATANVELHYAYIRDALGAFLARYQAQAAAHAEVLSRFEADLAYLASVELHPALRGSGGEDSAAGQAQPTCLLHLVDAERLREAAAACGRGHQHFAAKVAELEGLWGMLRADVEALFMQAPSVDLEALARQLEEQHGGVEEQGSIVAALSSDLAKVQQLVEAAGEQAAGGDATAAAAVSDTVAMLEAMREAHVAHLAPRVEACHAAVEAFAVHCLECKNGLTRDVFSQLRTISSQQSKIREMKNRLALFREALGRQDGAVQELLAVRRVPAAYKQCLAECVRREAFMEKYAHSAAQLAERMGTFRGKELAMRDSFRKHVERLIPSQLLERMGLLEQPPHCQVSVSAAEGERLLGVTVDDVRRIQLPWGAASLLAPGGRDSAAPSPREQQASAAQQQQAREDAAAAADGDVTATLQLENAKLRAELASQIALDCIRAAQQAGLGGGGAVGGASPALAASASSPHGGTPLPSPGSAASSAAPAPLPPEAALRFERALAAKDGLAAELQAQLGAARQQAAAYEARIGQLEAQLAALAAAADGRTAPPTVLAAAPPGGTSAAASSPASAASSLLRSSGSAVNACPAAAAAPSAASSATAASRGSASPSASLTAQQAGAAAAMASVLAAAGSSLAGSLHAPDPSRSLGHSSSSSPPASLRAQLQPSAARAAAAGGEEQPPARGDATLHASEPPAAAGSAHEASQAQAAASTSSSMALDPVPPAEQASSAGQPAQLAASAELAASREAAAEPAAPAPAAEKLRPAVESALAIEEPSPPSVPEEAVPPPAPPQLLSSVVVDEGSDVEGIEPLDDSSDDERSGAGYHSVSGEQPGAAGGQSFGGQPADDDITQSASQHP